MMDDQMCGKRYDNPRKPNRDVCILERGHEGGCENNIGQNLPTITTIEQRTIEHRRNRERLIAMSDEECINGLRQEEMG